MSIDDLLRGIHHDRIIPLRERLAAIELEINHRRLIGAEETTRLFAQLQTLHEEIMLLKPEGPHAIDLHQLRRAPLEREHRELERDLVDELAGRWRDEQALRREQRELQQTLRETWQQYERHTKDYTE